MTYLMVFMCVFFLKGSHNICLYNEADKKYTGCNLKTMELLDCALIGVCVVIKSNMVCGM